jgi:hypothetical protein
MLRLGGFMKKSNKITFVYIICSLGLLSVLIFGGVYGIYISVGLNFVKSSMSNISNVGNGTASNVSLGGSVNFQSSMTGVIILSVVLIVLAVFDLISLVRQIVLFKQFKMISSSKMEKNIEKKVKSKGAVVFFAVLVDILSFLVGVAGIFVNSRAFVGNNISWVLYLIDGLVSLLALLSLIFLIAKLKKIKFAKGNNSENNFDNKRHQATKNYFGQEDSIQDINFQHEFDIDDMEYKLLKLKHLKSSKIISFDEYEMLRSRILGFDNQNKHDNDDYKN